MHNPRLTPEGCRPSTDADRPSAGLFFSLLWPSTSAIWLLGHHPRRGVHRRRSAWPKRVGSSPAILAEGNLPLLLLLPPKSTKRVLGFRFLTSPEIPVVRRLLLPDGGPRKLRRRRRQGWCDGDGGSTFFFFFFGCRREENEAKSRRAFPYLTQPNRLIWGILVRKLPKCPCLFALRPNALRGILVFWHL